MAIFTLPIARVGDDNFRVGSGYKLYFYEAGTLTAKDTYTDNTYATPLSNPVVADGNGRFPVIWTTGGYKVILKTDEDVTVWTVDDYSNDTASTKFAEGVLSAAGSAANVITANLPTTPGSLVDQLQVVVELQHGANTIVNPTFSLNGLTATVMKRDNNQDLLIGDTGGAGYKLYLSYSANNGVWILLNPYRVKDAQTELTVFDYEIDPCIYARKSLDVSSESSDPESLFVGDSGTKLYVLDNATRFVYQYAMTTAWDLATASYTSLSFDASGGPTLGTGLFFKDDGLSMYIAGSTKSDVEQYTLSSAWDVSTASAASKIADLTPQITACQSVAFGDSGTKMYGADTGAIYQYTLSTAWDVSTYSYASKTIDVSAQDNAVQGVEFNEDGTRMFIIGNQNDSVYQYTLSTAWDLATASYDTKTKFVGAEDNTPREVRFGDSGLKMYVVGDENDSVYQYHSNVVVKA